MKINWKAKLTSRKFWAAVIGFISPTMIAFGASDNTVAQAVGIVMAGATLIAYILGEGFVDAARSETETIRFETISAEALDELSNGKGE